MAGEKVKQLYGTTRAILQAVLEKGIASGESIEEMVSEVDESYQASERTQTIAETEVVAASNFGSVEAAKASDMALNKVWMSMHDARTRPDHADADEQEVGMDEPFVVGGEALMYPGDPAGSAGNIINCRCTIYYTSAPAVPPEESDIGKALMKYVTTLPQLAVTREQYRELLRAKR